MNRMRGSSLATAFRAWRSRTTWLCALRSSPPHGSGGCSAPLEAGEAGNVADVAFEDLLEVSDTALTGSVS